MKLEDRLMARLGDDLLNELADRRLVSLLLDYDSMRLIDLLRLRLDASRQAVVQLALVGMAKTLMADEDHLRKHLDAGGDMVDA